MEQSKYTLHNAAKAGDSDLIEMVLSTGADVNQQDEDGRTPLHYAVLSQTKLDAEQELLRDHKRSKLTEVQHSKVVSDSRDPVYTILSSGTNVNVNIQDKHGRTPLHLATQSGVKKCIHDILENGVKINVNIKDAQGQSALDLLNPFSEYEKLITKLFVSGVHFSDIDAWFQRRQISKAMRFQFESLRTLIKVISTAGVETSLDPICWQWEVPAALRVEDWTPVDTMMDQLMDTRRLIVLTRKEMTTENGLECADLVQATTCEEYLKENFKAETHRSILELLELIKSTEFEFPSSGKSFMQTRILLSSLISIADRRTGLGVSILRDGSIISYEKEATAIHLHCSPYRLWFDFRHSKIDIMEVLDLIEALDWLCRTLRSTTPENLVLSEATYSLELQAIRESDDASQKYFFTPCVELKTSPLPHSKHSCWQQLFRCCTVTNSGCIGTHSFGQGLEISFDSMISLAAIEFCLNIRDEFTKKEGLVLIGYQTILFPTAVEKNCAQFHLITTKEGQINPYILDLGERVLTTDVAQFQKMKCFLGWCDTAQINLGTRHLPATVKWSGGQTRGKSLHLEGYSLLAQIGASAPLSAVVQVQADFKYAYHHQQFTPLGNYSKLLHDTARELIVVYDATQRRSWLVPKLSLLLHMSRAYVLRCKDVPEDRVPYVEPHVDAAEVIQPLIPLGNTVVYGEQGHEFLFHQLLLGLNINLLKTTASKSNSSGKSLFGFDFMDIVTEPGRGTCMKELKLLQSGKFWTKIANVVDAVVVCSELGEAIVAADTSNKANAECNKLPKDLDYLATTLPCLVRLAEREGVDLKTAQLHNVKIAEKTLWSLTGNPFQVCQHNSSETCWEQSDLVQQLVSEDSTRIRLFLNTQKKALPQVPGLPLSGAVVFGQRNA